MTKINPYQLINKIKKYKWPTTHCSLSVAQNARNDLIDRIICEIEKEAKIEEKTPKKRKFVDYYKQFGKYCHTTECPSGSLTLSTFFNLGMEAIEEAEGNKNKQIIFHGGCHGCTNQENYGIDYCSACQYRDANWSFPNLHSENNMEK